MDIAEVPTSFEQAEQLAAATRAKAQLPDGPIPSLGTVAERLGLLWFAVDLGALAGDGACVELAGAEGGRLGVAVINGSCQPGRRRWTLAHELGHFIMGDAYAGEHPAGDIERFIDAFVAYFLMPRTGVERVWREVGDQGTRRAALALAARYRVSWSAACNQLRNVERIGEGERIELVGDIPRRGEFIAAGEEWSEDLSPPAVPPAYSQAVLRDYAAGEISIDRTIDLLRGTIAADELPPRLEEQEYLPLREP